MSYVRFHWADSDLYVFGSVSGIECCGCRLVGMRGPWTYTDPAEFIEHVAAHERAGHVVKPGLAREVWEEWRDAEKHNDTWYLETMAPFDPECPAPDPPDPAAVVEWQREVRRDLGMLLPFIGQPDYERDGTPANEWRTR